MKKIEPQVVQFFRNQGFVVVSTVDRKGIPHSACKGIVEIKENGQVYLLDLYRAETYENLTHNPSISITAVDEHRFTGYCLKGKAELKAENGLKPSFLTAWEQRVATRLTQRVIRNMRGEKGHLRHPEIFLPKPEYLIKMRVEEIVDLTPRHIREEI